MAFLKEFIVKEVDATFHKLLREDFATLRDLMIEEQKRRIRVHWREDGFDKSQLPELLFAAETDAGTLDIAKIQKWAWTPDGCREIWRLSLKRMSKSQKEADESLEATPPDFACQVAFKCVYSEAVPLPLSPAEGEATP